MDRQEVLDRLDEERRSLARDGEILEMLPSVTRGRSTDGRHRWIISSSLTAHTADAAIAREIEHHCRLSVGFEWKLYAHDAPSDLRDRLERHGLETGPQEAVLVYDLNAPAAWMDQVDTSAVVRIERLAQIDDYRQVTDAVFDYPDDFIAQELASALRAGSTQHRGYIAYVGNEPVSVGRLYTHPESHFAGLYGGGTLAAWRGRGFYRALIAVRAQDAIAAGARYLQVDALPTSRPILERLGFQWITDTWPCQWRP